MSYNVEAIRAQFPSLQVPREGGRPAVFFDNPAGTQVPQRVIDAYAAYFTEANANLGGQFATSTATGAIVDMARARLAAFLNAPSPSEIIFGPNTTTLMMRLSRSLATRLAPGDEIVLTRLDHDANVAPWLLIARDCSLEVRFADLNEGDCTLNLASLEAALSEKTRLIATCHAANAPGTLNPAPLIAELAHSVGALYVLDAVQSAPHVPLDVQQLGCDFCFVSAYKFYGPHVGVMWGRKELLGELPAYKVRPAPQHAPGRWETGTAAYEALAAMNALMDYFAWLGNTSGDAGDLLLAESYEGERLILKRALAAIRAYESDLVGQLLAELAAIPEITIHGIREPARLAQRVPTVLITHARLKPRELAARLGARGIYAWHGDYYAREFMQRMGHGEHGMLRIGLGHYNTAVEIERLIAALREF